MAKRLVLDVGNLELPEVWTLSSDAGAVPLVFQLNKHLGWALERANDWVRTLPHATYTHALFRHEDGQRSTALLWNAAYDVSLKPRRVQKNLLLFDDLAPDPRAALFVRQPIGINAFLVFEPPLNGQEIVGLRRLLRDMAGLHGFNPRTSLTPNERAQFAFEPQ